VDGNANRHLEENYYMNKSDKICILHNSIGTYNLCRCYFNYDDNYWYFYILDYSEKFLFGIEEDDFLLDGFQIRKISDLKKIEVKDDICVSINEEKKLLENIKKPEIDLSSWKAVFESLKALNILIIVENENDDKGDCFFYVGYISKIKKSSIFFSAIDADGIWYDDIEIIYSKITSVTFGDRYSTTWQKYLSK
jgi:hypothetical protein